MITRPKETALGNYPGTYTSKLVGGTIKTFAYSARPKTIENYADFDQMKTPEGGVWYVRTMSVRCLYVLSM